MKTALFIRTYDGDLEWLKLCLRSVRRNASGFAQVLVVGDETGEACLDYATAAGFETAKDAESGKIEDGYIAQQATKMRADTFVLPEVETISFIDSDCVVTGSFTPEMLVVAGGIEYLVTPWSEAPDAEKAWRAITEEGVGAKLDFEFMRRQPMTYRKEDIRAAREWKEDQEGMDICAWMGGCMAFSEFNFLGAWCFLRRPEGYYWVDTTKDDWRHLPVRQFWSHGKKDREEADKLMEEMFR